MPESLLDQIHAARTVAESRGQHGFARWLTAHADEACPAAIAQFMAMESGVDEESPSACYVSARTITVLYTNHRGETAPRRIMPHAIRFVATRWHPEPQWVVDAFDVDRSSERSFALSGFVRLPSDPPTPDASRADAVKEAIAFLCGPHADCGDECPSRRATDALLAALSDAERERNLAIAHDRQPYPTAWAYEQVCEALETAKGKLADAEQRATDGMRLIPKVELMAERIAFLEKTRDELQAANTKEVEARRAAEEHARYNKRKYESEYAEREHRVATLTRQLETAREVATTTLDVLEEGRLRVTEKGEVILAVEVRRSWVGMRRQAIAAIDAPAAEGVAPRIIDGKFHAEVRDGRVVIVKTSSGEIVPEDEPLWLTRGRDRLMLPTQEHYKKLCIADGCNDFQLGLLDKVIDKFAAYAADPRRMKQPGITRGAAWNPDAPPPEPAGAQGSEACLLCGDHVDSGEDQHPCDCDCHEDDPLPMVTPPSAPPFTIEESRTRASSGEEFTGELWADDANTIVFLRNAAPRLLATVAELREVVLDQANYISSQLGRINRLHSQNGVFIARALAADSEIANLRTVAEVAERALVSFDRLVENDGCNGAYLYEQIGAPVEELRAALAKSGGGKC